MPSRIPSSSPVGRVAVLADSDTRWKWGALTARRIAPHARIDGLLLRGRATPTPRQLAEVGVEVDALREVTGAEFVRTAGDGTYDVVVLACVGGAVQAMLHGLARASRAAVDQPAASGAVDRKAEDRSSYLSYSRDATTQRDAVPGVVGPRRIEKHAPARAGQGSAGVRRPVSVTGYVGIVYEKLADGLLLRHGADVVLANSRHDAERFREVYQGVGADASSVVECALPFLAGLSADGGASPADASPDAAAPDAEVGGAPRVSPPESTSPRPQTAPDTDGDAAGRGGDAAHGAGHADTAAVQGAVGRPAGGETAFTVTFAVQPSVPVGRADRAYLLRRAAEHAREHPEREVLIKLRSKPGEHTTHIEEQPYQKLATRVPGGLPPNCRLVYGHMGEILDRTDLLVTVSSTAALESLHRSVPTAVLTDLGVREALGNHHFLGSGCLASWDELDAGHLPKADPEWTARQGVRPDGSYASAFDAARERVAELVGADELPPPAPYYTPVTAPGYLPRILARYGFRPDGSPRPGADRDADAPSGVRAALRNAVREAARGAYRHGVQRVAPVIRRMGDL